MYFVTFDGKYYGIKTDNPEKIKNLMIEYRQDPLFDPDLLLEMTEKSANTGEL
jgi:hypothetical protein